MGLCRSYDEVENIDSALAQRTISRAGLNHVPVPPSIQPKVLIQGAIYNFDHEENTKSGTDGSHDTILMLFQNRETNVENNVNGISVRHGATNEKKALNEMLHCQQLIRVGKLGIDARFQRISYLGNHTKQEILRTHRIWTTLLG